MTRQPKQPCSPWKQAHSFCELAVHQKVRLYKVFLRDTTQFKWTLPQVDVAIFGYPWSSLSKCLLCSYQHTNYTLDKFDGENQWWKCNKYQYVGTFDTQCPCYFRGQDWWINTSHDEDSNFNAQAEADKSTPNSTNNQEEDNAWSALMV